MRYSSSCPKRSISRAPNWRTLQQIHTGKAALKSNRTNLLIVNNRRTRNVGDALELRRAFRQCDRRLPAHVAPFRVSATSRPPGNPANTPPRYNTMPTWVRTVSAGTLADKPISARRSQCPARKSVHRRCARRRCLTQPAARSALRSSAEFSTPACRAVECENLALRCAHQDDASITANTTRQRSLRCTPYFAARGIKLNDLARCAGRVNDSESTSGVNAYRPAVPTLPCHRIFALAVGFNTTSSAGFCAGPLPNQRSK